MTSLSALSSAASALAVTRAAMDISSSNVANASTPGYSRQRVIIGDSVKGAANGNAGVGVEAIRRNASELIERQRRATASTLAETQKQADYLNAIDGFLGAPDEGIARALNGFYSSVNDLAREPENRAYRSALMTAVEQVKDIYGQLDVRFSELRQNALAERSGVVDRINQIATDLASTNVGLQLNQGAGHEASPDLLDQRDRLLLELNQLTDVEINIQGNGTANVKTSSGVSLVAGGAASTISKNDVGHGGKLGALDALLSGELAQVTPAMSGKLAALTSVSTASPNEFFEVTDANGQRYYTRSLSLSLNPLDLSKTDHQELVNEGAISDGAAARVSLVSPEGYTVSGVEGSDPPQRTTATARFDTLSLTIDEIESTDADGNPIPAGTVRTTTPALAPVEGQVPTLGTPVETTENYQLYVVRFKNPRGLVDLGNGYFKQTPNAAQDPNGSPVLNAVLKRDAGARDDAFREASTWTRLRGVYESFKSDLFGAFGVSVDQMTTADIKEFELVPASDGSAVGEDGLPAAAPLVDYQVIGRAAKTLLAKRTRTEADMTQLTAEVGQRKVSNDNVLATLTSMSTQIENERAQVSGVSMDEEALDLVRWQQAYAGASKVVELVNKMFDDLLNALR